VFDVRTQLEQIDATMSRQRLFAALTSAFGLLAVVLACVGIYGIMANTVASRVAEIGLRMALGAGRRQVLLMVLRETMPLAVLGVVLGIAAAAWLTRYIAGLLYELTPLDAPTALAAVLLMLVIALVAGWWPARAAASSIRCRRFATSDTRHSWDPSGLPPANSAVVSGRFNV
jgi:ABC-type antimicrobial peptide transport system permease subunit